MIVVTENSIYSVTEVDPGFFLVFKEKSTNGFQPRVKEGDYRFGTELYVKVGEPMLLRLLDGLWFRSSLVLEIRGECKSSRTV